MRPRRTPLRTTAHDGHLSACHFAERLVDTGAGEIFDAVGADAEALARFADTESEDSV
ncbi:hypothetical protein [Streptomyces sp. NPDC050564]|uniref:hypothetical protein n=1 Tax=Streptomyces sp. NPDC050564 TaxID=3365631 RepID=UPI0037B6627F